MRVMLTGGSGMVGRNMLAHPAADMPIFWRRRVPNWISQMKMLSGTIFMTSGRTSSYTPLARLAHQGQYGDPVGFYLHNLQIGTNILLAARDAGVRKVINLGSTCISPL